MSAVFFLSLMKSVLNFIHNPKLTHILVVPNMPYGAYTKLKVKHSKRRGIVKCTDEDTRFHYSLIEMKNRNYNE